MLRTRKRQYSANWEPRMPEPIRLYLDEDTMSRPLVWGLRSRSVDVLTAKEAGLVQIPDEQHVIQAQ